MVRPVHMHSYARLAVPDGHYWPVQMDRLRPCSRAEDALQHYGHAVVVDGGGMLVSQLQ